MKKGITITSKNIGPIIKRAVKQLQEMKEEPTPEAFLHTIGEAPALQHVVVPVPKRKAIYPYICLLCGNRRLTRRYQRALSRICTIHPDLPTNQLRLFP